MLARTLLVILLALSAATASAQRGDRERGDRSERGERWRPESRERPLIPEQRQRMREDVRDAYRKAPEQNVKTRQEMSPEQREKLRQDIRDANKALRR